MVGNEKISVIIPVYGVEKYLPKCLDSIIHQTYQNLEIILVDDESPDRCGEICDEYARRDSRVRVIHQKNTGAAAARNHGLAVSTGEYINFVDSDDWIRKDSYELFLKKMKQYDADCVVGHTLTVYETEDGLKIKHKKASSSAPEHYASAEDTVKKVLLHGSAAWNRLFKRELLEDTLFPVGRINDDEAFILRIYSRCKKIVFLNQNTYYYRIRPNSITTSRFSLKNVDCYYNSLDNRKFILKNMPSLKYYAAYKVAKTWLYSYINVRRMKKSPDRDRVLKELMFRK